MGLEIERPFPNRAAARLERPRWPAARAYPRRPAGLAAAQYYRTPRALPGASQQERTAQANRCDSLVEGVGLEPRVDDAASDAVAAGRRPNRASISNRISREDQEDATKLYSDRASSDLR